MYFVFKERIKKNKIGKLVKNNIVTLIHKSARMVIKAREKFNGKKEGI